MHTIDRFIQSLSGPLAIGFAANMPVYPSPRITKVRPANLARFGSIPANLVATLASE